jgi:hypothetical protein
VRSKCAHDTGGHFANKGDEAMPTLSQDWAELCREHKAAKRAHDELFSANVAKFTVHFDGKVTAGPSLGEIAKEEKCREALEDVQARMRAFVEKNT